jgi:hypothetical protein
MTVRQRRSEGGSTPTTFQPSYGVESWSIDLAEFGADELNVSLARAEVGFQAVVRILSRKLGCSFPPLNSQTLVRKPAVTSAFLAPNKSPTKSRMFSKTLPLSSFIPFGTPVVFPSLTLGARVANPASTAHTLGIARRVPPRTAVGHHAGNPAHAAVPPAGPPLHHHRPEN